VSTASTPSEPPHAQASHVAGTHQNVWVRFWELGRWWKAVLLVVVYFALYQLIPLPLAPLLSGVGDPDTVGWVLGLYALPILIGCVLLVIFGASTGWLRSLFAGQPIRGHGWMWIAVAVVLLFNVLHFASIDYGAAGAPYVLSWMLTGLFIGFAEETLTRGYVVRILREAGHPEIVVAVISAALFALLHAGNLLSGQAIGATLIQLVYTFGFGICMYLAMRVTGTLLAPILIHASTDPSIFLQTEHPVAGPLGSFGGLGNIAVIVVGLVLLIFIRGRVGARGGLEVRAVASE